MPSTCRVFTSICVQLEHLPQHCPSTSKLSCLLFATTTEALEWTEPITESSAVTKQSSLQLCVLCSDVSASLQRLIQQVNCRPPGHWIRKTGIPETRHRHQSKDPKSVSTSVEGFDIFIEESSLQVFHQHAAWISWVSMTTAQGVMTTEALPRWRVEHPDSLSASCSNSLYRHGYQAIPCPLCCSVQGRAPNSSLV